MMTMAFCITPPCRRRAPELHIEPDLFGRNPDCLHFVEGGETGDFASAAVPIKDGLLKLKDFAAEVGGSAEGCPNSFLHMMADRPL
jgi:hypothetical protein